jgi:hypothetical protein
MIMDYELWIMDVLRNAKTHSIALLTSGSDIPHTSCPEPQASSLKKTMLSY